MFIAFFERLVHFSVVFIFVKSFFRNFLFSFFAPARFGAPDSLPFGVLNGKAQKELRRASLGSLPSTGKNIPENLFSARGKIQKISSFLKINAKRLRDASRSNFINVNFTTFTPFQSFLSGAFFVFTVSLAAASINVRGEIFIRSVINSGTLYDLKCRRLRSGSRWGNANGLVSRPFSSKWVK